MAYDLLQPFSLVLLATAAFCSVLAAYVASFRQRATARSLVGVLVGAGIWALADGLRIASPTRTEVLFWNKVTYVGVALIAPATLLFVAGLTNRDRWFRPRRLYPLLGVSVLAVVLVFTNQWHGLWRAAETVAAGSVPPVIDEELGVAHVAWDAYVLLFVVPLVYVWLLSAYRTTSRSGPHRRQIALILFAVSGPVVTSTLYVTGVTGRDFTPISFAAFGLGLTVAITRYRLFDIVPVARATVLDTAQSGVIVVDDRDRVLDVNPAAAAMVGAEESALIGRDLEGVFGDSPSIDLDESTDWTDRDSIAIEVDGERRHYQPEASPVTGPRGNHLGRVIVFSDVTAAVRREEQLLEQTRALERKNEHLDEFASVLSHDLRNPLTVASLRLQQVETDDESELESAQQALDRIERMSEQLLTLARAGSDLEATESVDLGEIAGRASAVVGTEGSSLSVADDLCEVQGDPDLLLELFENLLRNAVEHTDGEVTVTVENLDGEEAGFVVADDGQGFDDADVDQLFDHGYTTAPDGTGYGLAIVEDIAQAHDWSVAAADSEAGGARFEFRT